MAELDEPSGARSAVALASFGVLTAGAALVGARATLGGTDAWYAGLEKPSFTPPARVFGPVWSGLYVLMAVAAWRVWRRPASRARTAALALWGGQLVLNALWSPLFFGRHRVAAALADTLGIAALVSGFIAVAHRVDRPAAYMMIPYLGWTGFAATVNEEILRRNP